MAERARVLSIDGGGIRGIIPALVLVELEKRAGKRTFELFDLIAGTSTGGILACALCAPDPLPAAEIVKLYEEDGPEVFERSLFQRCRARTSSRRPRRGRRPRTTTSRCPLSPAPRPRRPPTSRRSRSATRRRST